MGTDDHRLAAAQRAGPGGSADQEQYPHQQLTREIIAAAYEVYNELGPGFLEKVYENALMVELTKRGLKAQSQTEIEVRYKSETVGVFYADLFVSNAVICEIKAAEGISNAHQAQLLNYLTGC